MSCIHFISFSVQCISKQHRPHNAWVTVYLSESFSESDHSHEANVAWVRNNNITGEPGNVLVVLVWKCYLAWRSLLEKEQWGAVPRVLTLSSINGTFKHIPDYSRASEPLTSRSQSTFLHLNTTVIRQVTCCQECLTQVFSSLHRCLFSTNSIRVCKLGTEEGWWLLS